MVDVPGEIKTEDIKNTQLWECMEQGVHTIVQIIVKYVNWSVKEQEKRVLDIIETISLEWFKEIDFNCFGPARFPPSSATAEAVN